VRFSIRKAFPLATSDEVENNYNLTNGCERLFAFYMVRILRIRRKKEHVKGI